MRNAAWESAATVMRRKNRVRSLLKTSRGATGGGGGGGATCALPPAVGRVRTLRAEATAALCMRLAAAIAVIRPAANILVVLSCLVALSSNSLRPILNKYSKVLNKYARPQCGIEEAKPLSRVVDN